MAPIRRYLRITKYSVIEVRIYLDNPALAQTWLLSPRHNVLPRVIEAVRPLVLPKLREEKERARKRSTKKKGIKDLVAQDDFEVSIFLTETSTRHSLLTKHKHFHDTTQTKLTSNSGRLVGASNEAPIDVDLATAAAAPITLREEDSDDDAGAVLASLPSVPPPDDVASNRRSKRARRNTGGTDQDEEAADPDVISSDDEDGADDELFVQSDTPDRPPHKRHKAAATADLGGGDDKKKLAMDISYEGFAIYGRVLCLVVTRRDWPNAAGASGKVASGANKAKQAAGPAGQGGQAMMENFIMSTQVPAGEETV